ncbi:uncharacterized protein LOC123296705 [Chrysoperla carnea]|uniref:uncharacterized protein LOC123296705 n=1 Tax=Chrysoperla carnea TaxID=189513 RepID=UPI001D076446|nr:uncharacterized protein LOC123296705 [Chrysoperla carnea]
MGTEINGEDLHINEPLNIIDTSQENLDHSIYQDIKTHEVGPWESINQKYWHHIEPNQLNLLETIEESAPYHELSRSKNINQNVINSYKTQRKPSKFKGIAITEKRSKRPSSILTDSVKILAKEPGIASRIKGILLTEFYNDLNSKSVQKSSDSQENFQLVHTSLFPRLRTNNPDEQISSSSSNFQELKNTNFNKNNLDHSSTYTQGFENDDEIYDARLGRTGAPKTSSSILTDSLKVLVSQPKTSARIKSLLLSEFSNGYRSENPAQPKLPNRKPAKKFKPLTIDPFSSILKSKSNDELMDPVHIPFFESLFLRNPLKLFEVGYQDHRFLSKQPKPTFKEMKPQLTFASKAPHDRSNKVHFYDSQLEENLQLAPYEPKSKPWNDEDTLNYHPQLDEALQRSGSLLFAPTMSLGLPLWHYNSD